jgi:DNA (cytosine-5)-methyltransferase 1
MTQYLRSSSITVTDMFCGAGGSSTGAVQAGLEVRLAMNHWQRAIETHNTNHPNTTHVLADVSQTDPSRYPMTDILIASPECTNHSLAKGKSRTNQKQLSLWQEKAPDPSEERSRATMWDPVRFAEQHDYRFVILENVVDARHWRLWDVWLEAWKALDYTWEIVFFNSMFAHPTPQSRDRMYIVFSKRGNPQPNLTICPPAYCQHCAAEVQAIQSWKDQSKRYGRYGKHGQYVYRCPTCANVVTPYYYAAANAIDWSLPVQKIGDRKHPLKPNTLRRIEYGLEKFADHAFLVQHGHGSGIECRLRGLNQSIQTITGIGSAYSLVTPYVLNLSHGTSQEGYIYPAHTSPLGTQTTRDDLGMLMPPPFLIRYHGTTEMAQPLAVHTDASTTVTANYEHHALITPPAYLMSYYGNSTSLQEVIDPLGTVSTHDHHALVLPEKPTIEECGFRMLEPHEIQAAMAFPSNYTITGNRREKVKQLGNAVTPPVMRLLLERCTQSLGGDA